MAFYLYSGIPNTGVLNNVLVLPDPVLGNTKSLQVKVDYKESMDGTERTYVRGTGFWIPPDFPAAGFRTVDDILYTYNFENVGRGKMLEAQDYLRLFAGSPMVMMWTLHLEHNGNVFLNQESTVFTYNKLSRLSGGPRQEAGSFTLAFIRLTHNG